MEILAIGLSSVVGFIFVFGLYKVLRNITFLSTENPYEYVMVKSTDGSYIEKVIDHTDKEPRDWEWKV